jgi:acyl-CoA hydrolase
LAGVIVTEYGAADLRGKTVAERARAMVAIAHPEFRDELSAVAGQLGR